MKVTCLYNTGDYLTKETEEIFNLVIKRSILFMAYASYKVVS